MSKNWVVVLQASEADAVRKVGGVPLALRLALDAQATGAGGVIDETASHEVYSALRDSRLRIPVMQEVPAGHRAIVVPSNWLMHRSTFATVLDTENDIRVDLAMTPPRCNAPWGFDPILVVDSATAKTAERALFRSLRKVQDGWTSRWLNRYLSLFISRWLARSALTPNQISALILAIGLLGAYLASRGSYACLATGAVLFQMQSVLDGCDGEVSRVTFRGSKAGEWIDTIGDDLTNYAFFAGAALGLYRSTHQFAYVVAGAVTVACGLLSSGLEYRYLIRIGSGDLLKYPLSQATTANAKGLARIGPLFKRDTFVFLTMLAAIFNRIDVALVVFAIGAIGITVAVLRTELRLAHPSKGVGQA